MMLVRFLLLAVAFLGIAGSANAAPEDPEGSWALTTGGRTLALLDLRRDARAPGGWAGAWITPKKLAITQSHSAYGVEGPVARRAILSAVVRSEEIDLSIESNSPGGEPTVYTFKALGGGYADFGWKGNPIPPLALVRVEPGAAVATVWDSGRDYPLDKPRPSNPEMRAMFRADQDARKAGPSIDWSKVAPEDARRRLRTMALLDAGELRSGDDFFHAAFIFQHGSQPEDYLLAHSLATVAIGRGRPDATWIAAATLDRYLQSIGQKQVYGTQFMTAQGKPTTQEPYDRTLISDALRAAIGVPPLAEQEKRRAEIEKSYRARQAQPSSR
jgi:hypothetical protein